MIFQVQWHLSLHVGDAASVALAWDLGRSNNWPERMAKQTALSHVLASFAELIKGRVHSQSFLAKCAHCARWHPSEYALATLNDEAYPAAWPLPQ